MAVGDFNRDGIPDLAVAHFGSPSDVLSVLPGNGDGTFRDPVQLTPGPDDGPVAVGDFNGDGFVAVPWGTRSFSWCPCSSTAGR